MEVDLEETKGKSQEESQDASEEEKSSDDADTSSDDENKSSKKPRVFNAKLFRKEVQTAAGYAALKQFVKFCNEKKKRAQKCTSQDCAREYLEDGGSLLEILNFLPENAQEKRRTVAPCVFEAFNIVLMKILSAFPNKQIEAEETCKRLLAKYIVSMKYLFGSKSNFVKKQVLLKLLSTIVTLSPELAKDVLMNVRFSSDELEFLTRHVVSKTGSTVRTAFIHFLASFLIEGNTMIITSFLDQPGLFTSIFGGLLYDSVETINIILTLTKNNVLQNREIFRTIKMNVFNTHIIQHVINLYNWKGPENFARKKGIVVNKSKKEKVSAIVHDFLLVLCASRRHGVVFYDPSVGLGGRNVNPLMLNVLKGLEKPWENIFAKDLITNICAACPDLAHYIFRRLEPYLEPRSSAKWNSTVDFIRIFLDHLGPECVEKPLENMEMKQIVTIAETFSAPQCIMQIFRKDVMLHEDVTLRLKCIELLQTVVENFKNYSAKIDRLNFPRESRTSMKKSIVDFIRNKLPPSTVLTQAWRKGHGSAQLSTEELVRHVDSHTYYSKIFDVLYKYKEIDPSLIKNFHEQVDPKEFLEVIEEKCSKTDLIQLKSVDLFLFCESTLFSPTTELFSFSTQRLIKIFYATKDDDFRNQIQETLQHIFSLTTVFDNCKQEILVWLYAILEQNEYSDDVAILLTESLRNASENIAAYTERINDLRKQSEEITSSHLSDLFETLEVNIDNHITESNSNVILSPLVLGLLEYLRKSGGAASTVGYQYASLVHLLHLQTSPKALMLLLSSEKHLPNDLLTYCNGWRHCDVLRPLKKTCVSPIIRAFSKFLVGDEADATELTDCKAYHVTLMVKMSMFYYVRLLSNDLMTDDLQKKYLRAVTLLVRKIDATNENAVLTSVLKHPVLLLSFKPAYEGKHATEKLVTDFVLCLIREIMSGEPDVNLNNYLHNHRIQLVKEIHVVLRKCRKKLPSRISKNLVGNVRLLELSIHNCNAIVREILELPLTFYTNSEACTLVVDLLSYILERIRFLYAQDNSVLALEDAFIKKLSGVVVALNTNENAGLEKLEGSLHEYISQFPHTVSSLDDKVFECTLLKTNVTKTTLKLIVCLYTCNPLYFKTILKHLDAIVANRELIFTLLSVMRNVTPAMKTILDKTYKTHENMILKFLNKPQKVPAYLAEHNSVVGKLITESMDVDKCNKFVLKNNKFDVTETFHAEVLTVIFDKCICAAAEDEKPKYISSYIQTNMNLLANVLKTIEKNDEWEKVNGIAKIFVGYCDKLRDTHKISYVDGNLCKNKMFQVLSKFFLKYGIESRPSLLEYLLRLCEFTDGAEELGVLFEMATSHSECLDVLLSENEIKPVLLHLLLVLCRKCPAVKCRAHIPVWLSAYNATLSVSDQYLYQLLMLYDCSELEFYTYRPFVWGSAAMNKFSINTGAESTLHRHTSVRDVIELFDEEKINTTVTYFPCKRKLIPEERLYSGAHNDVYDPAFYLPLFSYLLSPESTVRWYNFKSRNTISLAIVALSSEDKDVRLAACHVIARFYSHLESTTLGKDRLLWVHLIELICNGVAVLEDINLSTVVAVFLARCASVFSQPGDHMYTPLGYYIMAKEQPDFTKIPEFLPLFFSCDVKYNVHQEFILEVMRDGLQTESDFKVMSRTVAFKYMMDFFNCTLVSYETQILILEVIVKAVNIPLGAKVLTLGHGLLSWLQLSFNQSKLSNSNLVALLVQILHNVVSILSAEQLKDSSFHILLIVINVINRIQSICIAKKILIKLIRVFYSTYCVNSKFISRVHIRKFINASSRILNSHVCSYYLLYGIKNVRKPILSAQHSEEEEGIYYLKLLTMKWIKENNVKL